MYESAEVTFDEDNLSDVLDDYLRCFCTAVTLVRNIAGLLAG